MSDGVSIKFSTAQRTDQVKRHGFLLKLNLERKTERERNRLMNA